MTVPTDIESFVREFYRLSDVPDDQYLDLFHDEFEFHIGDRYTNSREGLREMRKRGAAAVASRVHHVHHLYFNEKKPNHVVVVGSIDLDRLADDMQIRGLPWMAKLDMRDGKIEKYTAYVHFPPVQTE
ncbi:hypothetical protein CC85DRAFT_329328 [Cutaneotrichosporon oleaginosum]|uniref:SnoaL-like domain-containing protein n=1 Tax=Cutaneotrichosporon oleaginosum TaxID=879819 RepID=A0A0J0XJ19_9TREE|nr:uncharacterized protein CC85DRAFT_329328 [Cutaneotrichosporon oleaginosum]KLT41095.1 hypothetical protein CC85DRAFT_329328 [Cutaneotrichosporon oleaginosum]TXT05772.1 hypothetical protein COLE_07092 [Cutaneotrichosporon oleaginosum]